MTKILLKVDKIGCKLKKYSQIWPKFDQSVQNLTQMWTKLDQIGQSLSKIGQNWTKTWTKLEENKQKPV